MKIIGIAGKARSGKDSVADYVYNHYPISVKYSLAGPLKRGAAEMFDVPLTDFYQTHKKEVPNPFWGISPREIAQKLGTEGMRKLFREDFWLKCAEKKMLDVEAREHRGSPLNFFIVPDIRFENEADWVRMHGGELWHIERPSLGEGIVRAHSSESGVEPKIGDVVFNNTGTILDLFEMVKKHMTEIVAL